MDLFEVIHGQRAYRAFTEQPVDEETIEQVLQAAVRAPSAENAQPWLFVVVQEKARRQQLGELLHQAWTKGARDLVKDSLSTEIFEDVDRGLTDTLAKAPVMIVVAVDTRLCNPYSEGASIYPAVQNLLLAAEGLGLGSTLTTILNFQQPTLEKLLALPDYAKPMAMVPLGWPEKKLGRSKRKPLSQVAFREDMSRPW